MIVPPSATRVEENTDVHINQDIHNRSKHNVLLYASAGRPAINRRLRELGEEWDIERILEANAASISLVGLALGAFLDRRWFYSRLRWQAFFCSMPFKAGALRSPYSGEWGKMSIIKIKRRFQRDGIPSES
ncbi:MAG: hypothetical protein WD425_11850 [Nitrospirales bacterium]